MKKPSTLMEIFDSTIRRPLTKSTTKSAPTFKPSMLGTNCLRKLYYSYNKVDEDYPTGIGSVRVMTLGTAVGEMFAEVFRKSGTMIDYREIDGSIPMKDGKPNREFPIVSPDLEIKKGYIDYVGILDGELWLGEFKSANSFSFNGLSGPKSDHLVQGITYLYVFNKMLREGFYSHIPELAPFTEAKGMRYVYLNKDTSMMKEFVVTANGEFFKSIVMKMIEVKSHTENGTLPEMTKEWCNSCPWRAKCAKNQKN